MGWSFPPGRGFTRLPDGSWGIGDVPQEPEATGTPQSTPPLDFSDTGDEDGHERALAVKNRLGRGGGMDYGDPNFDPRGTDRGVMIAGGDGGGYGGGRRVTAAEYDRLRGAPPPEASPSFGQRYGIDWMTQQGNAAQAGMNMSAWGIPAGGGAPGGGGGPGGGLRQPLTATGGSLSSSGSMMRSAPMPALPNTAPQMPTPYQAPPMERVLYDQLSRVLSQPGDVESHPFFKWRQQMGEQALGRSLGAKRMRLSGKGMTDFINYGQGLASQAWGEVADRLGRGSEEERNRWSSQADIGLRGRGQEFSIYPARLQDALARDRAEQGRLESEASSFFQDPAASRAGSFGSYAGYLSSVPQGVHRTPWMQADYNPVQFNPMTPAAWQQNRDRYLQYGG